MRVKNIGAMCMRVKNVGVSQQLGFTVRVPVSRLDFTFL